MATTIRDIPNDHSIQLPNGEWFDLLEPNHKLVKIEHIAMGLSNQARYNGLMREHYSIAQHSWYVSRQVPSEFAYQGLMHDAHEAYQGDLVRPYIQAVKTLSEEGYQSMKKIEDGIYKAISKALFIPGDGVIPPEVKEVDRAIIYNEKSALCDYKTNYAESDMLKMEKIRPWSPEEAYERFMGQYWEVCVR